MAILHKFKYGPSFMAILLIVVSTGVNAKSTECHNSTLADYEFLDEQAVFCESKSSLQAYLDSADLFDLDGMNKLVLDGRCDFVPDGEYLRLENYETHSIDSELVIAINLGAVTIWTSKKLVSRGDPEQAQFDSGNLSTLVMNDRQEQDTQCIE